MPTDREKDLGSALGATAKSALSIIPGVGQAIAGYDAYRQSAHNRNVEKVLGYLTQKVDDLETFFNQDWFRSAEGELFLRKTIDAAIDVQSEEKQELFVNVLVNGAEIGMPIEQKTKFVDMLRQLSLSAVQILAELHTKFEPVTRRPGKEIDPISPIPVVDPNKIAQELSDRYTPYLTTAAIRELESHGLFSNTGSWNQVGDKYQPGQGFLTELAYTDFSASFADFISFHHQNKIES